METEFDDSSWATVRVPHDWAIAGPFARENDLIEQVKSGQADIEGGVMQITGRTGGLPHTGEGWYRTMISIPEESSGRRFRLECDGVMSHSSVYVNGKKAGSWAYGYSSFAFDVTDLVHPGSANLIAVHVNNPPQSSRWYPGAGIYREVRLVELHPVHIDQWGISITTPEITDQSGRVRVNTVLMNCNGSGPVTLRTTVLSPDGAEVAQTESEETVIDHSGAEHMLEVDHPRRWSLESPEQYSVVSEVWVDGEMVDSVETRFGFRTLRFDAKQGFFLNDQPVKMKGVCLHHDLGPLGAAFNLAALRRQFILLKEMGCNAIRTSHNPPAPELPALASEMGFLVIDEAFDEWRQEGTSNGYHLLFDEWAEKDMRALIRRDRNHPAVIMWSIGNEIPEQATEEGARTAKFLLDICHDEDPTRPVTAGINNAKAIDEGIARVLDIPGWNYMPNQYVDHHLRMDDKPQYGSETASTVSSRGEYFFPAGDEIHEQAKRDNLQVNSFDLSYPSWATAPDVEFRAQDECRFCLGEFVWTGFDYLGEPSPYMEEWPSRSSYFGILDLAGLPKDRYYIYQAKWSSEPVLHLMPHWNWEGLEGQPVPVQCYTNYPVVELFVNGVSAGKQSKRSWKGQVFKSPYRFLWPAVPYEPGELKVVAMDREGNRQAEYSVKTAGPAHHFQLTADRSAMRADGDDMLFVTVDIVDENGVLCPEASDSISFKLDGPAEIAAVCNGDATSLESFKGTQMKAFHGKCAVYLRSVGDQAGTLTLTAQGAGLAAGVIKVKSE